MPSFSFLLNSETVSEPVKGVKVGTKESQKLSEVTPSVNKNKTFRSYSYEQQKKLSEVNHLEQK